MEYGGTLNLPRTDFPMRGNLPQKEPEILKKWQEMNIYEQAAQKNRGKKSFYLHDGPPYANGHIHLGHVLNKVLKDIVVKYKSMAGYDAPFIPGWDTHGLPIEQKAIKDLGVNRHQISKGEFRRRCGEYALKYVNIQREEFKRLGVRADWDNPYLTLNPEYEAAQIDAFWKMARKGSLYKGLKPVYWCPSCETALAEAEVEYEAHKSASIYVKFKVKDGKGLLPPDASFVIWTTTPWTIPANLAICLNPDFIYTLIESEGEKLLIARELKKSFLQAINREDKPCTELGEFKGSSLERLTAFHPLFDREALIILGGHVTAEAGTGCVHTAPGHGVDDFNIGRLYGLDILSPLDDKGRFTAEAGEFAGLDTVEGNKAVVKALDDKGALLKFEMFSHQYPHCWRCHTPILFRATEQWFASIDDFRAQALEEIDKVRWIPSWGHDRIYNMIRDRGDWCISRQRIWGVPIPIFYCDSCGEAIINDATVAKIKAVFAAEGSSAWYTKSAEELIPAGLVCPKCSGSCFHKEEDTMDVWFDSGSSYFAVMQKREGIKDPADLYLEGSDQHRGWFNSSLCIAVANSGHAPYKQVLTHGFFLDERGDKVSKSRGNAMDPQDIINRLGADVLRLWVASTDYRSDMAISPNIMKQISETYRKIRNTTRYLLGNLYDFDPARDGVAYENMAELDRWALIKLNHLVALAANAYAEYEFHTLYHGVNKFCVTEMSAFYLDVVKDCLYAELPDDARRRSTQTALYQILNALTRILTPVLAFTAEEIYSFMPKDADAPASVQLLNMPIFDDKLFDRALEEKWESVLLLRETVMKELETARQSKIIGHSLDAKVILTLNEEDYKLLSTVDAAKIFIVSQVELKKSAAEKQAPQIKIEEACGKKCLRCWIYSEDIEAGGADPGVCPRCVSVLSRTAEKS